MKNIYIELFKRTSNTQITFLKDIKNHIKTDKSGKFKYFYISYFQIKRIEDFILNLDDNSLYTVIPILSIFGKDEDPHLILSKQILITKFSNPLIIKEFLNDQLNKAFIEFDFNIDNKYHYLIFKFKKISIFI